MCSRAALATTGLLALLSVSSTAWGQTRRPEALAAGKLLVAPKDSQDPVFGETVILLVRYDSDVVAGLVINHRTNTPVSRLLRDVKGAANYSGVMYSGGPVEFSGILGLLRSEAQPEGGLRVMTGLYLIQSRPALEGALGALKSSNDLHLYAGYCGWAPDQLESEVRRGAWHIFNGSTDTVFDSSPDTLWHRLITRTETRIAAIPTNGFHSPRLALVPGTPGR